MIILASEDVGLADPYALSVVISCAESFDRIGFPEGRFPLAHACLYLATCPKSNTTLSFFDALKEVDREDAEVPNHLRDASRDAEGFGHGEGYIYPHSYRDHWAAQQYLPTSLRGRAFYIPSEVAYEGKIRADVLQKRELQAAVILGDGPENTAANSELLSWSASAKGKEGWFRRLESGRSAQLLRDRQAIFKTAAVSRQSRNLIPIAADGLLLWESLRRCPEGLSAGLVGSEKAREALQRYASALDQIEQPEIAVLENDLLPNRKQAEEWFSAPEFDRILIREPKKIFMQGSSFAEIASSAKSILAKGGILVMLISPPALGQRISRLIQDECGGSGDFIKKIEEAENEFFSRAEWNMDSGSLSQIFETSGFTVITETIDQTEERLVGLKDIKTWFDSKNSRWGSFMAEKLDEETFAFAENALTARIQSGPVPWKWKSLLIKAIIKM